MSAAPTGWSESALGDVCQIVSGATPRTGDPLLWGGEIPWLTPLDMSRDRSQTLAGGERFLTQLGYKSCSARLVPAGSVVVSSRAPVGYVAIAGQEMCTNQGCKTAVPPDFLDSRYLYWYLLAAKPDLEARASGTTFKEISSKRFAETRLRWPDLSEQRRIVEILEDHLSRLDMADTMLARCERMALVAEEAWLRRLAEAPADEVTTIGKELRESRGGWSRSARHLVDATTGVPYLKMNNITRRGSLNLDGLVHVEATDKELATYALRDGDILFNSKNSGDLIGKTAKVDHRVVGSTFNENIMRLRFSDRLDPSFVVLWFMGPQMREAIRASASASTNVAAVYKHQLVEMPLWVPRRSTQLELIGEFSRMRDELQRLAFASRAAKERSEVLRRAVLAAAFEGKLTGRRTDDEVIKELAGV